MTGKLSYKIWILLLYPLHLCSLFRYEDGFRVSDPGSGDLQERQPADEENEHMRALVASLRAAVSAERGRRENAERECTAVLQEFERLEQRLLGAEGCQQRVHELEAELQELQQLRKSRACLLVAEDGLEQTLLSSAPETDTMEEVAGATQESSGEPPVRKSCSDTALDVISGVDASGRRKGSYALHANGVRKRGMSILREVDEQYHALLERYEELLGKCRRHEESLRHAEVQTSRPVSRDPSMKECRVAEPVAQPGTPSQTPSTPEAMEGISRQVEAVDKRLSQNTPEYKALFKEIFSRLQKTKTDINSTKGRKSGK